MKAKDITTHKCCGCRACEQICPKHCIIMRIDDEGFWYPVIDERKCINCKQCVNVCPLNYQSTNEPASECYAFVGDEEKLMSSSSGGAFEAICHSYLADKENYAIYGASLNKGKVQHIRITSLGLLALLKRSKYVQSNTESVYQMVKEDLDNHLYVVFSGTPCQVQALRNFLKGNEDRLITIDVVCHGVPSPLIFQKYCEYLSSLNNSKVESFVFRYKQKKNSVWDTKGTKVIFANSSYMENVSYEDGYMVAFLNELITRPSCYECPFMSTNRCSDFTLGDFWGIEDFFLELSVNQTGGCSLILTNTEKGKSIVNNLVMNSDEVLKKCDLQIALKKNIPLSKNYIPHKNRKKFVRKVKNNPNLFPKYLDIYLGYRKPFLYRLKRKLKIKIFDCF